MKVCKIIFGLLMVLVLISGSAAFAQEVELPDRDEYTTRSIAGSFVEFFPYVGDHYFLPGETQTLCFEVYTQTDDWEWVLLKSMKFPTNWIIEEIFVHGIPTCDNGGTFFDYSWEYETGQYEVTIIHERRHEAVDSCRAVYCMEVIPAGHPHPAHVSWFIQGDRLGAQPHSTCSDDDYAPNGLVCEEAMSPPAFIPGSTDEYPPWEKIAAFSFTPRNGAVAAAVGGKVYLLGGLEFGGDQNHTVEVFDPATNSWTTRSGLLPEGTAGACAAAIGDHIYVVGGYAVTGLSLDFVQRYNTANDTWNLVDPLPVKTKGASCAVVDGRLFVMGGETTHGHTIAAYVYDPAALPGSRWTSIADMFDPARSDMAAVVIDGIIYVAGGQVAVDNAVSFIDAYDPATNTWSWQGNLNSPRYRFGGFNNDNELIFCGGGTNYALISLGSCEVFDTVGGYSRSWTFLDEKMNSLRAGYAFAALGNSFYAIGGHTGMTSLTNAERMTIGFNTFLPLVLR